MTIDPVFWSVVALAAIVVGLAKSGLMNSLGMIGVPLLTLVMPARDAAGMMLPVLLCMDAVAFVSYRKSVNRPLLMLMLPGAMIGIGIAWALSSMISDEVWSALAEHLDERQLLELPVLVGHYHMTAFLQNAIRFEPNRDRFGQPLEQESPA